MKTIASLLIFASLAIGHADASILFVGQAWGDYAQTLRQIPAGSYLGTDALGNKCLIDITEDTSLCSRSRIDSSNFPGCPNLPALVEETVDLTGGGFDTFSSPASITGGDLDTATIVDFVAPSSYNKKIHVQVLHQLAEAGRTIETLDLAWSMTLAGAFELTNVRTSVQDVGVNDLQTRTCTGFVKTKNP